MKAKLSMRFNLWLQLFLVVGICIVLNVISAKRFERLDLTEQGLHTLDIKIRGMVWDLEKPLYAKVFFTPNLEGRYRNNETQLLEKLEELRAYSRGLLIIERFDPTESAEIEELAEGFGIQPTSIVQKEQGKRTEQKAYMGLALVYGDRQETLPPIQNPQTLEYDLAKSLKRLRAEVDSTSVLAFSTGHGEINIVNGQQEPLRRLTAELQENHDVRAIVLGGEAGIPDDVDILWVVGPQKPLSRIALIQVDQFLMRGGALGVFLSNIKPNPKDYIKHQTLPVYHGLDDMLAHYGVTLNKDLLVDRKNNGSMNYASVIGFRQLPNQQRQPIVKTAQLNHPAMAVVSDLNSESAINRGVQSMVFPFSSTLELNEPLHPGIEAQILATSSASSGRLTGVRTYKKEAFNIVNPGERTGAFPMLYALTGSWPSYFVKKDLPEIDVSRLLTESSPTRLVVAGSSSFAYNNPAWMLNLADWMGQDEDLISIRSKITPPPPMKAISAEEASFFKRLNLLGGVGLIWLMGLIWWFVKYRRSRSWGPNEA